jgi:hypothetical protein
VPVINVSVAGSFFLTISIDNRYGYTFVVFCNKDSIEFLSEKIWPAGGTKPTQR